MLDRKVSESQYPQSSIHLLSAYDLTAQRSDFLDSRFKWPSKWDFITSTITCVISSRCMDCFISTNDNTPGIYHYTIVFALVILPIYNMQLLLGQYTQLGTAIFKYLSPISHGVGIVFIINLFLRTIRQSLLLDDAAVFFVKSMQSTMQWTICPPIEMGPCLDFHNSDDCVNMVCGNTTVSLPAKIFYNDHFLGLPVRDPAKIALKWPQFHKVAVHSLCWFFTCCVLTYTLNHYIKVVRLLCHFILILQGVLIAVMTLPDMESSFKILFDIKPASFTDVDIWLDALFNAIQLMALGRAFHIVHGSYLSSDVPCGLYSVICTIFYFVITTGCCLFTSSCLSRVAKHTNTDKNHLNIHMHSNRQALFVLIPQAIGFLGLPQVWSCLYFMLLILITLGQQVTHLIFMQNSLGDFFPNLMVYKRYVIILLSMASGLVGIAMIAPESFTVYEIFCINMPTVMDAINVLLMVFFVCWLYGVARFTDDIQFNTGQTVSAFWQIFWYIMPAMILVSFIRHESEHYLRRHKNEIILQFVCIVIFASPVPMAALIETFRYMKRKDLSALFHPQERFGSPDPVERELRMIYNPRRETKSRRRAQVCVHRCICGSATLAAIIEREELEVTESTSSSFSD